MSVSPPSTVLSQPVGKPEDAATSPDVDAYEIKTGLSRTRLSHLMDAETWMNARKALELGFCDEIMFKRQEAEADAEDSFLYSSRAVTNCLLNKLKAHAPKPEPRVKASDLEKRLALLKY